MNRSVCKQWRGRLVASCSVSEEQYGDGVAKELRDTERVVLGALMHFNPAAVTFDELARYLAPGVNRVDLADALAELRALGLVHVIATVERTERGRPHAAQDEFVLAGRAARRAFETWG
jgi:hypothetical protein